MTSKEALKVLESMATLQGSEITGTELDAIMMGIWALKDLHELSEKWFEA